jgi:hypothetical protein
VPAAAVYILMPDHSALITALIFDRQMCLPCIASKSRPNLLRRFSPNTDEPDVLCALCGKRVDPAPEVEVREGEKRFHLACYVDHKRQAPPPPKPPASD